MSNIVRFIADLHFGHKSMAIKRGFKSVEEHDEHIIKCWNSVVGKRGVTYILGDVTMESKVHYDKLDRLDGRKVVILGNHDRRQDIDELLKHVDQVAGMTKMKFKGKRITSFLTHCPIHPRELEYRVGVNIHGHIHEYNVKRNYFLGLLRKEDERYINVSCEQIDYTPKTIDELYYESK